MISVFRFTYQDRALNKLYIECTAAGWAEAICKAFSYKKAEEKLLLVEWIRDLEEKKE